MPQKKAELQLSLREALIAQATEEYHEMLQDQDYLTKVKNMAKEIALSILADVTAVRRGGR